MLSRVAESLYWTGRLTERAGHVAQLLDVHLSLLLDSGQTDSAALARFWQQFLALCADPAEYARTEQPLVATMVSDYVIAGDQPGGILAALTSARESTRGVRESISSEVWEQLNTQYWQVKEVSSARSWEQNPHAFLQQIKSGMGLLYGLVDETMLHDQGWSFLCFGRYFERAMNTARLLDGKFNLLTGPGNLLPTHHDPIDPIHWAAILRCCWAFEAYRRHYAAAVTPTRVAEFLLLNPEFPRSVNFSVGHALELVKILEGPGNQRSQAERWLGSLSGRLTYATIDEVLEEGLHGTLSGFRDRCLAIEQAIYHYYFQGSTTPVELGETAGMPMVFAQEPHHQQQQQQ
jgi:uncharacterized alpha-E superfamily protein